MLNTAFLLAASMVVGQAEEPNVEYEKLAVLEGILGTWSGGATNDGQASKWEALVTYSWAASRKMIIGEGKFRVGKADDDLTKTEWQMGHRVSFVWNHKNECIELYVTRPMTGTVEVERWLPEGNGKFKIVRLSTTKPSPWTADTTVTVTEDAITTKSTNVKHAEGSPLEDWELVLTRVEK